ncbi:MAG: META domain-containing protein, partial [Hyphomonadaceae bacterium]
AAVDLDGRWRVQQIAGASLGEGVVIWLQIDPRAGEVSGFTGCRDFTTSLAAYGDATTFGPVQVGVGECASNAAATDEERFLLVLPAVERRILRGRSLELLQAAPGSETLIRLRREDADAG